MRVLMSIFLAGCCLTAVMAAQASEEAQPRPNLVILLCDDLGYGDLGCFGHPVIKTPNLDALARGGMQLNACYSAAPVCSPSRVGLLTGRSPNRAGVFDWIPPATVRNNDAPKKDRRHEVHMRRSETTIPALLREVGYATCVVGKWHCNSKFNSSEQPQPSEFGFEHWMATQNNARPSHHQPKNFVRNGDTVGEMDEYSCQIAVSEALRWLDHRVNGNHPFFLFIPFHEPHEPVASPPDLVTRYMPFAASDDEACYYANVANVDRAVGRLIRGLEQRGVLDNTLVVFTSDNGPETLRRYKGAKRSFGRAGPLRGMKLHTHEAGVRVPGIMHWPKKIAAGQIVDQPVSSLDLLPTFCRLARRSIPSSLKCDGIQLQPLWHGKRLNREAPLVWCYFNALNEARMAMRRGPWKVMAQLDGGKFPRRSNLTKNDRTALQNVTLTDFEIYDLRDDLGEDKNLADAPELHYLQEELRDAFVELSFDSHLW